MDRGSLESKLPKLNALRQGYAVVRPKCSRSK